MADDPSREVWIGLVEVVPEEGNDVLNGGLGAYTNVLASAVSVEDYMAVTASALLAEGLIAVGLDDPEPLRERQLREGLSDEFLGLGEEARNGEVVWGTLHVFETDDEED